MTTPRDVVSRLDVDNILLDNDRMEIDLPRHWEREFGGASRDLLASPRWLRFFVAVARLPQGICPRLPRGKPNPSFNRANPSILTRRPM